MAVTLEYEQKTGERNRFGTLWRLVRAITTFEYLAIWKAIDCNTWWITHMHHNAKKKPFAGNYFSLSCPDDENGRCWLWLGLFLIMRTVICIRKRATVGILCSCLTDWKFLDSVPSGWALHWLERDANVPLLIVRIYSIFGVVQVAFSPLSLSSQLNITRIQ